MTQVSVIEAKNNLSALLRKLELGQEDCIVVARHNKPIAKLTIYDDAPKKIEIGKYDNEGPFYTDDWDSDEINEEIAWMMGAR